MVEEQFHRDIDDDRPIREARTPPDQLRDGEIEYRTCPYSGTRLGQPMNASALKQTGARWDEIVDALALLRAAYTEARGGYGPDLLDISRVSQLGSALPWFYILRAADGRSPAFAAALSKATLGTGILAQRLFVEMLSKQTIPEITSAALLDGAEWTGTMHAEHEVCAASEKMILRFVDVLVEPGRTFAGIGQVAPLVAERAPLLAFGAHYIAFKHLVWMYYLARRFLYADLAAELGDHERAAGARAALGEPCEPPDFFVVGPSELAAVPLDRRGVWFRTLALPLVPLVPDRSDAALCALGVQLASVMSSAPDTSDVSGEISRVSGVPPSASGIAGRVLAQFVRLDALFGDAISATESGFRTAYGRPPLAATEAIDARLRDRVLPSSPRAYLTAFAPSWMAAHARP